MEPGLLLRAACACSPPTEREGTDPRREKFHKRIAMLNLSSYTPVGEEAQPDSSD